MRQIVSFDFMLKTETSMFYASIFY